MIKSEREEGGERMPTPRLTDHFITSYSFGSSLASQQDGIGSSNTSPALRRSPRRAKAQTKLEGLGARSAAPPKWSVATSVKSPALAVVKGKRKAEGDLEAAARVKVEPKSETAAVLKAEKLSDGKEPDPADLPNLNDHLREDIDIMFVGINPGIRSSQTGHHFAHPSNHFYKALHLSGITSERVPPSLDRTLLDNRPLALGLTNLCSRPSRNASFLTRAEKETGSPRLVAKMRRFRPLVAAFVGKGIGEDFAKCVKAKTKRSIRVRVPENTPVGPLGLQRFAVAWEEGEPLGWRAEGDSKQIKKEDGATWMGEARHDDAGPQATLIFVMPSTSGLVTSHRISDKAECFAQARRLTEWLKALKVDAQGAEPATRWETETKEIELALIDFAEDASPPKK